MARVAMLIVPALVLIALESALCAPYLAGGPYDRMDYMVRSIRGGQNSIKQPVRPETFENQAELQNYLKEMRDYLNIIGRQRFGRSVDSHRNHLHAGKATLLLTKDANDGGQQ